ncbi:NAD(P)/FAD-dependent oxidoreductase [Bailinhaonella thermotolerans]|uniref:FAD-dependent oxidoreductase n=1 Tax=Bailinhaonella thermotolerans TaxID=1070861 RepID=A0A3A3ZZN5_9ACTN|nr:FAD-dependent oxidoreductase [Bailinhaonella thermotolerans]RJL20827.1 FAD-dependent oxidoreductase [Bailinhaonella thermotolerans]
MIDLLVVGGGPAGLAAAVHAARSGWSVAVLEPRVFPVDKPCGEGLMPRALRELSALGVAPPGRPFHGIRYLTPSRSAEAPFREGPGLAVRRTDLHAALAARAAALGVDLIPGKAVGLTQATGHVDLAYRPAGRGRAGGAADCGRVARARWVIAADGLGSSVRRILGLDVRAAGERRFGLRRHYRVEPWSGFVEVHWAAGAEAYVTPVAGDLVGVAVLTTRRGGFDEHLAAFPGLAGRLTGPAVTPVRGAGPLRRGAASPVAGRVLLVGDAAGYVDALTGEGVSLALAGARAAVECLRSGRPGAYAGEWRRLTRSYRLITAALLRATATPAGRRLLVPAAARLPALFRAAVNTIA